MSNNRFWDIVGEPAKRKFVKHFSRHNEESCNQQSTINLNRGLINQAQRLMGAALEGRLTDFIAVGFVGGEPCVFSDISLSRKLQMMGLLQAELTRLATGYEVEE